jgi:cytochrome P450
MRDIARRYGPLVLLRLGRLPVVVVSSAEAAREVMVTHDVDFATRPFTRTLRLAIPEGANGIIFTPYGDEWRQIRKICTVELLSARRVHSFRSIREEEVSRLLREVAVTGPAVANLSEMMAAYVTDSAVRTIIGSRLKNRAEFLALLDRGSKLAASMSLPDFYPSSRLAMLVSRMPRRVKRLFQEQAAFFDGIIREHQENRAATADYNKYHEDLLDVLLRIQGQDDIQLSTGDIKATIMVSTSGVQRSHAQSI